MHTEVSVWKDVYQKVSRDSYFWVVGFGVISIFLCFSILSEIFAAIMDCLYSPFHLGE